MKDRSVHRLSSFPFLLACLSLTAGLLLPLGRTALATPPPPPQISGGDPDAPGSSNSPHTGEQSGGSATLAVGQLQGDQSGRGTGAVTPLGQAAVHQTPQPTTKNNTSWARIKGLYR